MNRQMTVTEASRHFADLVNRTFYRGESTMLIRSGEPVAKIVPVGGASLLGRDWLARWSSGPRLDQADADDFAAEVETARSQMEAPIVEWD